MEKRIMARIAERMRGKTMLIVSHRTGADEMADRTVRIAGGRVEEPPAAVAE
jgi:ABC-type transport system involved in cytochrome bd biosynthesis fused ATPase/permease subunit